MMITLQLLSVQSKSAQPPVAHMRLSVNVANYDVFYYAYSSH